MAALVIWSSEGNTSSNPYKMRLDVTSDTNTSNEKQNVTLQMYFKSTSRVQRYRHDWVIKYYIDDKLVGTVARELPNTPSAYTYLNKDEWYAWGDAVTATVPNDGQKHSFKVEFTCETFPKSGSLSYSRQMPSYTIVPDTPTELAIQYNEDTDCVTYSVNENVSGVKSVYIRRTFYDENSNEVYTGETKGLSWADLPYSESIADNVTRVVWSIIYESTTGDRVTADGPELNIDRHSPMWVKTANGWKKTKAWVRVNGVWKRVTQIHCRKD